MAVLKRFLLSLFFIVVIFLFWPKIILAQVVINEFSSNSNPEWVELYNNSDSPVDLTGWSLKDEAQLPKFLTGTITARGYFVFENSSGWLNDSSGDTITLSNNISPPAQVDQVIYGKSGSVVGTPASDKSAGRTPDGSSTWQNQLIWTKLTANPNPSSPTPIPTSTLVPTSSPTSTPSLTPASTSAPAIKDYSNIFISEFMAYPESSDEWVELYNGNNFEVDLYGWYIDDIVDEGSSPRPISGTISPGGYKQFFLASAYLNNSGDDVRLLNGSQQEKDKKSFESSIKGKSWVKDKNGNWCQSEPTPNKANPDCPSSEVNSTPSPTPTPTPKILTPTPSQKTTPTPTLKTTNLMATDSGEILGEEVASFSAFYPYEATEEAKESGATPSAKNKILPKIFLVSGLLLLFASACWLWYNFVRN